MEQALAGQTPCGARPNRGEGAARSVTLPGRLLLSRRVIAGLEEWLPPVRKGRAQKPAYRRRGPKFFEATGGNQSPLRPRLRFNHAAVAELDQRTQHRRSAALRRAAGASNDVALGHRLARPAVALQVVETHHLDFPSGDFAIFARDFEIDVGMRIGPFEPLHFARNGRGSRHVVHGGGMMRAHGHRPYQQSECEHSTK